MARIWMVILALGLAAHPAVAQSAIVATPGRGDISGNVYGEVYSTTTFLISGVNPSSNVDPHVKFQLDRVVTTPLTAPNFLIVTPSSGGTPRQIRVSVNPNVTRNMRPGTYSAAAIFTTVDQSPARTEGLRVTLTLRSAPPPAVGAVVNTASSAPVVSPGGMVSIFGTSLGPPVLSAEYDVGGLYPTTFGNTTVTFNGIPAPLLYMSPSQINAVVPYGVAGQLTAQVVVSHYGDASAAFSVPVADTSPAIFTATQGGSGQGAILNYQAQSYSYNSADNPAAPGSVISLFATGAGVWDDTVQDAGISLVARPFTAKPVSLTIAGQAARILYAGAAPYLTNATLQVNAVVPESAAPGAQPIVLTVGQHNNAQQQVTIAIQ